MKLLKRLEASLPHHFLCQTCRIFYGKGFYATEPCIDQDSFEQPYPNDISDSGNSNRNNFKSDGLGENSSDKIENLRNIRLSRYYYGLEDMNEHGRLGAVSHRCPQVYQRLGNPCLPLGRFRLRWAPLAKLIIDPRHEWSILSGPRIQTLPSWLLISWKKVHAVSCSRIHITNIKIL